jgi:transcriptional regulator with XRE-family HTH domain
MLSKLQYLFRIFFTPHYRHSFSRMKPIDRQRHIAIGKRLREFRESLRIPRTSLALWVGIGSNQLASYESGRAALPWGVFRDIAERFRLNPYWLATGQGKPELRYFFSDSRTLIKSPKDRFADVFDTLLKLGVLPDHPDHLEADALARTTWQQLHALKTSLSQWAADGTLNDLLPTIKLESIIDVADRLSLFLPKKDLTDVTQSCKSSRVLAAKSELDALMDRLAPFVSLPGSKTALAAFLHVPLPRVSEWLNRKFAPSAETVLKILRWVEDHERKLKRSDSAQTLPELKTQRTESIKHEKHHPSSRKQK